MDSSSAQRGKISPFSKLIKNLKAQLTPDNIEDIKLALHDEVPPGKVESVVNFLGIVKLLEQERLINRDRLELSYLIELLDFCERPDLQILVRDCVSPEHSVTVSDNRSLQGSLSEYVSLPTTHEDVSVRATESAADFSAIENTVDQQAELLEGLNLSSESSTTSTDPQETRAKSLTGNSGPVELKNMKRREPSLPVAKQIEMSVKREATNLENTGEEDRFDAQSVGLSSTPSIKSEATCSSIHEPATKVLKTDNPISPVPEEGSIPGSSLSSGSTQWHDSGSPEDILSAGHIKPASNLALNLRSVSTHEHGAPAPSVPDSRMADVAEEVVDERPEDETHSNSQRITLRNYQIELAGPGLEGKNSIICAPTGSGKTFTAGHILATRLNEKGVGEFKGLFIVCIRSLIEQQATALRNILTFDKAVAGIKQTENIPDVLKNYKVIVLTAQILINGIANGEISLSEIDVIVMDECHHTTLKHPYNVIMNEHFHKLKRTSRGVRLPQVIGLTASLGVGADDSEPIKHYIKMCANLDCDYVTHVRNRENYIELLEKSPKPKKDQIVTCQPRAQDEKFMLNMRMLMMDIERSTFGKLDTPERGTQQYESLVVEHKMKAEESGNSIMLDTCEALLLFNVSLQIYKLFRAKDAVKHAKSLFEADYLPLNPPLHRQMIYDRFQAKVETFNESTEEECLQSNEKLEKLHNLLNDLFTCEPESKGIVLTRTLNNVGALLDFINDFKDSIGMIKAEKLVGQGSKDGMTDAEQDSVLKRFRATLEVPEHYTNLLVATDVAQEGLDMPKCNFVIRYDFVSNEIGTVQAKGRARAPTSECYLIVDRGSINEAREYANLEKEHLMLEALDEIDLVDQTDLRKKIIQQQDQNWNKILQDEEQKRVTSNLVEGGNITVVCKYCGTALCRGSEMRRKGSNFICTAEDIEDKLTLRRRRQPLEFRYDLNIGESFCANKSCDKKLGPVVQYKEGTRRRGFAFSKDSIMLKVDGQEGRLRVKQWTKVPFTVTEEKLFE